MYLSNDFGEGIVSSSHRSSTDLGAIYAQLALAPIQSVNGVVVISGYELASMIMEAFNQGRHTGITDTPSWGQSIHKATVSEMIQDGKSFEDILKAFK